MRTTSTLLQLTAFTLLAGTLACTGGKDGAKDAPKAAGTAKESSKDAAKEVAKDAKDAAKQVADAAKAAKAELTAEQKAAEEAIKKAAQEQSERIEKAKQRVAEFEAEAKKELERWTDDVRTKAKGLAEKDYKNTKSAVKELQAGAYRTPGNAERDKYRHPAETLDFLKVTPKSTVVEVGSGAGWYTELLAPLLAKQGKLIVVGGDPNADLSTPGAPYAKRTRLFLDKSPELFSKVEYRTVDDKKLELAPEGTVDVVLVFREMHGWATDDETAKNLEAAYKALKPGGILGIEQHRAKHGADPKASAEKGYLPEAWVIAQAEAVGFKLDGKSEINANPKDTKDYPEGVWQLPPALSGGDKDKEKYLAIGESDRMTLRFVKPAK